MSPADQLIAAAESAADWLCEAQKGTDQHERGTELRKAIRRFTRAPSSASQPKQTAAFDRSSLLDGGMIDHL